MVNITNALNGGVLEYGSSMDSDKILQDWLDACQRKLCSSMGEAFVSTGSETVPIENTLLEDVEIQINNGETDFSSHVIKMLIESEEEMKQERNLPSDWLTHSAKMIEAAKLMSSSHHQKLLALALSTTLGKPSRYCVQNDILPAISYWNYYAENLCSLSSPNLEEQNITIIVVEPTDQPILDICRALCPYSRKEKKIILLPVQQLVLPCLILAEMLNEVALDCSVYIGNSDAVSTVKASYQSRIDVIFSGSQKNAGDFPHLSYNMKLNPVGKKVVVAMETGDCDAAVDAAITGLKNSVSISNGLYMITHDSLLEDIKWRLRDRLARCKVGHYLDKMTDVLNHPDFLRFSFHEHPQEVTDYLERTDLEVSKVGNALVVYNAQLSCLLTQMDNAGQTMFVLSYRSVNELATILANISNLSELSLWVDHQGSAWQLIHQTKAQRIWVNGIGNYEPGFDQLIPIQQGCVNTKPFKDGQVNVALYAQIDKLRAAQRNWATQGKRNAILTQFLKQLLTHSSFSLMAGEVFKVMGVVNSTTKGAIVEGSTKNSTIFDLKDAVGLVAILDTFEVNFESVLRVLVIALLNGNAVVLSSDEDSKSTQEIMKMAKQVGLADVILLCPGSDKNVRALMKHHAVQRIISVIGDGEEYTTACDQLKSIWYLTASTKPDTEEIINHVTLRKRVWMAYGDGLAN